MNCLLYFDIVCHEFFLIDKSSLDETIRYLMKSIKERFVILTKDLQVMNNREERKIFHIFTYSIDLMFDYFKKNSC